MDLLDGFVIGGIKAGDCVIVIATANHLAALEERLKIDGFNVFDLKLRDQYIPLYAEQTLSKFMINNWPDENLFRHLVTGLLHRAKEKQKARTCLWRDGCFVVGTRVQWRHCTARTLME